MGAWSMIRTGVRPLSAASPARAAQAWTARAAGPWTGFAPGAGATWAGMPLPPGAGGPKEMGLGPGRARAGTAGVAEGGAWGGGGGGRAAGRASSPVSAQAPGGWARPSPPRVAWFRERTAPAAVRARARVWPGESVTAFLPLFLLLFWFFLLLRFLRAADEELAGDRLAHVLACAVARAAQARHPGGGA